MTRAIASGSDKPEASRVGTLAERRAKSKFSFFVISPPRLFSQEPPARRHFEPPRGGKRFLAASGREVRLAPGLRPENGRKPGCR